MESPSSKKKKVEKDKKEEPPKEEKKEENRRQFHCDYCSVDITSEVRIKCAVCQDFDLCCDCFTVGVETSNHKSNHSYSVIDDISVPLFTSRWTGEEETLLLEGIEMYGLGNWVDIADHVGTKNKNECDYHYFATYIDVPEGGIKEIINDDNLNVEDYYKNEKGMHSLKSQKPPPKKKKPIVGGEIGFLCLRGDFEQEFEHNAEDMLAYLSISKKDSAQDLALKEKVLMGYDFKLEEREKRKAFAIERGLVDYKKITTNDKKSKAKDEREMYNKLRPFYRFCEPDDFTDFVNGLLQEKKLKQKIQQLQVYRTLGIQTFSQVEKYESLKKTRDTTDRYHSKKSTESVIPVDIVNNTVTQELLTVKEKEICSNLKISPKQYFVIKDAFLRQDQVSGFLKKNTAAKLLGQDMMKASKLYDFFVNSGWVQP